MWSIWVTRSASSWRRLEKWGGISLDHFDETHRNSGLRFKRREWEWEWMGIAGGCWDYASSMGWLSMVIIIFLLIINGIIINGDHQWLLSMIIHHQWDYYSMVIIIFFYWSSMGLFMGVAGMTIVVMKWIIPSCFAWNAPEQVLVPTEIFPGDVGPPFDS